MSTYRSATDSRAVPLRLPSHANIAVPLLDADSGFLAFQYRVLEEACDARHPLLERVKFLAIAADSLADFVQRRPAGTDIVRAARALFADADEYLRTVMAPRLTAAGISIAAGTTIDALWPVVAIDRPDLQEAPFVARVPAALAESDPFAHLRHRDLLVHRPYESFDAIVALIVVPLPGKSLKKLAVVRATEATPRTVAKAVATALGSTFRPMIVAI